MPLTTTSLLYMPPFAMASFSTMIALMLTTFLPLVLASIQCTLAPSGGALLANASTGAQGGPGSGPGNGTNHTGSAVATAWYAGWHAADFPVANVSWGKYTSVIYAFAFVAMS